MKKVLRKNSKRKRNKLLKEDLTSIILEQISKIDDNMTLDEIKEILYFKEYQKVNFLDFEKISKEFLNKNIENHKVENKAYISFHLFKFLSANLWVLDRNCSLRISILEKFMDFRDDKNFKEYLDELKDFQKYFIIETAKLVSMEADLLDELLKN
jgi:hypothetical protein